LKEEEMATKTQSVREVPVPRQNGAKAPAPYHGFDGQYIDGLWRPGKHGGVQVDTDPYSGATLAETVMANQHDLDEAYHAAAKAQVSWAARIVNTTMHDASKPWRLRTFSIFFIWLCAFPGSQLREMDGHLFAALGGEAKRRSGLS
jgi:hypothetical protein